MLKFLTIISLLGFVASLPSKPILRKLDSVRYQYAVDSKGENHLADMWMNLDHIAEAARYNPVALNVYHLFTRENPTISQPLLHGNEAIIRNSNFSNQRRTIILLHGWRDNVLSDLTNVLVPALLEAEDLNVLAVDWSAGSSTINYPVAVDNAISSGFAVAAFIDWVNSVATVITEQYHIIGHGLGGHQAGIASRHCTGNIPYTTGLDPSFLGWIDHPYRFQPGDAMYTEVIHTNAGINGYVFELAHADFYPNGGESMPGCDTNSCDHLRSIHYLGESIRTGGFTGRRCATVLSALLQVCSLPGSLPMGGLRPKIGSGGIFSLATNESPPFSQG